MVARSGALTLSELDRRRLLLLLVRCGASASARATALPRASPTTSTSSAPFTAHSEWERVRVGIGEALTESEQRKVTELVEPSVVIAGSTLHAGRALRHRWWGTWARLAADGHAAFGGRRGLTRGPPVSRFSSGYDGRAESNRPQPAHSLVALVTAALVATRGWGP